VAGTAPRIRATYVGPVHPDYFADPFVWSDGREYCAIGTGRAEAAGRADAGGHSLVFPLLRSRDLVTWTPQPVPGRPERRA